MDRIRDNELILDILERALIEDIGEQDITTEAIFSKDIFGIGKIIAKDSGIIAGLEVIENIFLIMDEELKFHPRFKDGSSVNNGDLIAVVAGNIASIVSAERVALNFLQRMSGIATLTSKFVEEVKGTGVKIYDTRKTVPGLRIFDKMAVKLGGGENHRFGLNDMFLIKENHIEAAGSITGAIEACLDFMDDQEQDFKIEVEVKNLDELSEVLNCGGVDIIMLDNFQVDHMIKAVQLINHRVEVEASGGINLENIKDVAATGVNRISIGALTHSPKALDISLLIER